MSMMNKVTVLPLSELHVDHGEDDYDEGWTDVVVNEDKEKDAVVYILYV